MTIRARYPSKCPACKKAITVGSTVNWERGLKATHLDCGTPSAPSYQPGRQYARSSYLNRPAYAYDDGGQDDAELALARRERARDEAEYQQGRAEGERYSAERRIYGDALAEQFAMQDELNRYNAGLDD